MTGLYLAIQVAFHLAYMVVIPLFLFGGLGLWLDKTNGTTPFFLFIGIGIALAATLIWITKQLKKITEAILKK
jgi:hypothetical protein